MKEKKYKTIKDVTLLLGIKAHIIRYWDSKFQGISTRLSKRGQRYFSIDNIKKIQDLQSTLYDNGKHNYSLELANKIITQKFKKSNYLDKSSSEKIIAVSAFSEIEELKNIRNNLKNLLKI